jgi:hypothetical protein
MLGHTPHGRGNQVILRRLEVGMLGRIEINRQEYVDGFIYF